MSVYLEGCITIDKRLCRNPVWQRKDYGWAWIYMLILATDRQRLVPLGGRIVTLERGQLAWSERSLAREFEVSRAWIRAFLEFCKDSGMISIKKTPVLMLITILNYNAYNPVTPAEKTTNPPTLEPTLEPPTGPPNVPVIKKEERGENPALVEIVIPSDEEVEEFCKSYQDTARGINGIPEVWWRGWLGYVLGKPNFPADWKRALRNAFLADWAAKHPKAIGSTGNNCVSPVSGRERGEILQSMALAIESGDTQQHEELTRELESL